MLKKLMSLVFLFLILSSPVLRAQDPRVLESVASSLQKEDVLSRHFGFTVMGTGELVTHPGKVFTAERDYEEMTLPSLLSTPKPLVYPKWALRQGWQGELVLAIEILADGTVGQYAVMKSTGRELLDQAGVSAVKTWMFEPAAHQGKAFRACIQIPITFEISDAK